MQKRTTKEMNQAQHVCFSEQEDTTEHIMVYAKKEYI